MAIPAAMNNDHEKNDRGGGGGGVGEDDEHEHDMVMPGFRFHPTEEELVEFYLRRKVEGKRFNVELITFLDLYRYDPWELPALATIGEKEWYFYVPRDRKYRNGDRPNRVTTSGYWKATGADRMIRGENSRSIGLKKTLVFYTGKAPKGTRTSWIMNEYRLPHHDTERYQKAEISLCRVYKRPGVEDYSNRGSSHHLPRSLPATRASSSRAPPRDPGIDCREKEALLQPHHKVDISLDTGRGLQQPPLPPLHQHSMVGQMNAFETGHRRHQGGSGSSSNVAVGLLPRHHPVNPSYKSTTDGGDYDNYSINHAVMVAPPAGVLPTPIAKEHREPPPAAFTYQQPVPSPLSSSAAASSSAVLQDELHRLVNYYTAHHSPSSHHHHLATLLMTGPQPHPQQQQLRAIWEWNQAVPDPDYNPDNSNTFK